jgi:hypothetical protein
MFTRCVVEIVSNTKVFLIYIQNTYHSLCYNYMRFLFIYPWQKLMNKTVFLEAYKINVSWPVGNNYNFIAENSGILLCD